jgi:hypothetical protein
MISFVQPPLALLIAVDFNPNSVRKVETLDIFYQKIDDRENFSELPLPAHREETGAVIPLG